MFVIKYYVVTLVIVSLLYHQSVSAFDDDDDESHHNHESASKSHGPLPKDKVLLKDVKTLSFQRNKRTTAKRTHSIPQLSCVGGTAGCKLFTPNEVECENIGFDQDKSKFNWRCHAEMSERVIFNHVEVICEGYDYPEDDYILLGSCGLEFTLDYASSTDYHHYSYFHHMDDHEKELHREKVQAKQDSPQKITLWRQLGDNLLIVCAVLAFSVICVILITRLYFSKSRQVGQRVAGKGGRPSSQVSYGPAASAIMSTKKAC